MRLHRFIMKPPPDKEIDHINDNLYGDKRLDNRKQNLRVCNRSENGMNRDRNANKQSSVYKDVFENDAANFRVIISGENFGTYSNEDAAANAYNYYVSDLHGEFAYYMNVEYMKKAEWMSYRRYPFSSLGMLSSDNTSGFSGVRFSKNRWQAAVYIEGKEFYVGRFISKEDAIKARDKAEEIKLDNINDLDKCKSLIRELNENSTISGVKGVTWCKKRELWTARIQINKKRVTLGDFEELEDAVRARKIAELNQD